jgi:hypothetical protein
MALLKSASTRALSTSLYTNFTIYKYNETRECFHFQLISTPL